jgi:hypothetical protein
MLEFRPDGLVEYFLQETVCRGAYQTPRLIKNKHASKYPLDRYDMVQRCFLFRLISGRIFVYILFSNGRRFTEAFYDFEWCFSPLSQCAKVSCRMIQWIESECLL